MWQREAQRRAGVFIGLSLLAAAGLVIRMAQVQLVEHDALAEAALEQRSHTLRLEAPRGEILDRNGKKLATSRMAYRLQLLYPAYVTGNEPNRAVLGRLAELLHVDLEPLLESARQHIASQRFYEPLLIKSDLSEKESAMVAELKATVPGLYVDAQPVRTYPLGPVAAHVIGHVGEIEDQAGADRVGLGAVPGDIEGKMGLESQYDRMLRGTPGSLALEVDAYFRPTGRSPGRTSAKPGGNLQLTVDVDLQRTVEESLDKTLLYIRRHPDSAGIWFPKADRGAAVVMDVHTGAILAMASYPGFNPNQPERGGDFFNRAVGGEYMPGSTWKMLSGASALENGVVQPDEKVFCSGTYDKLERKHDWTLDGHGWVDLVTALADSCDIYFYEMGYRLGVDRLAATAGEFGFGKPTGVDLPAESEGWIPDTDRRRKDTDLGAWNGGKLLSAAIGQGLTATPLQLARYTSILANGGQKVRPHLAAALVDGDGKVLRDLTPPPDGKVNLSARSLTFLVDGMEAVTEWGTSRGAFKGLPFKVAGKTGTAEVEGKGNCAGDDKCQYGVYVAFAPADKPEVAVAVVGERAGHGDSMNPVARAAIAQYFHLTLAYNDPLYTNSILPRPAGVKPPMPALEPAPAPKPPVQQPPVTTPPVTTPPVTPPPVTPPPVTPPPVTPPPVTPPPVTPPPVTPPPVPPPPVTPPPTPPPTEPPKPGTSG